MLIECMACSEHDRVRGQDIRLLQFFKVSYIFDLMLEMKKVKFGMKLVRRSLCVSHRQSFHCVSHTESFHRIQNHFTVFHIENHFTAYRIISLCFT